MATTPNNNSRIIQLFRRREGPKPQPEEIPIFGQEHAVNDNGAAVGRLLLLHGRTMTEGIKSRVTLLEVGDERGYSRLWSVDSPCLYCSFGEKLALDESLTVVAAPSDSGSTNTHDAVPCLQHTGSVYVFPTR